MVFRSRQEPSPQGAARRTKGDFRGAVEDYLKAIELDPECVEPYYNLGYAHYSMGETESAVQYWKKTVEMDPNVWQAWNALGVVYKEQRKLDVAIDAFTNVLRIMPGNLNALENRALLLWSMKRYKEGANDYESLARIAKDDASHWYSAAAALAKIAKKEGALAALKNALEYDTSGRIRPQALRDPALAPLRTMPEFRQLFAE